MHYARDVEKLITAAEELSLGPDENELANDMSDNPVQLSQPAGDDSQASLDKNEAVVEGVNDEEIDLAGAVEEQQHQQQQMTSRGDVSTTEYLPYLTLHVHSPPGLLPRYPSWSLICLGSSSLYSHNSGLSDQPGFLAGSGFLLPWDVAVRLPVHETVEAGRRLYTGFKGKRSNAGQTEFTVKLFVGIEYECPRGHRFMSSSPGRVLKATGAGLVKDTAQNVTQNDVPLYLPCPCPYSRGGKALIAQLMRIHIVTPKASVHLSLEPKVRPAPPPCPEFVAMPGSEALALTPSSYWILRLPYIYEGKTLFFI